MPPEHVTSRLHQGPYLGHLSVDIIWEMSMKADWRTSLVSEAIQAFSSDLNYAVAVVTPRKSAAQPRRVVWGSPPRFVRDVALLGRSMCALSPRSS